ncbi:MAG: DUF3987 domain-containing protein, partial [Thermomicrobiales bacterium]
MADHTSPEYVKQLADMQARIRELGKSALHPASPTTASPRERHDNLGPRLELEAPLPLPPPFPLHVLPPSVAAYVQSSAVATRAPAAMIAAPLLAFTGAVIGRQLRISVSNGWEERPVLWVATVAPTGSGKTPALDAARRPLDILQERAFTRWQLANESAILDRLYTTDITTDITTEALALDLKHSVGLAIVRDELVSIVRSMDQYRSRGGDDRQKYLSLWSHQPLVPSRKSQRPILIPHPVVCIAGGLQPLVVSALQSRDEDGFIERFLPIVPDVTPAYWDDDDETGETLQPDLLDPLVDHLALLRSIPAVTSAHGLLIGGQVAKFPCWRQWFNDNVDHQADAPQNLHGFYQKLPAHVARFALVLHALWEPENPGSPLTENRVADAISLGEFFRLHIHRLLPLLQANLGGSPGGNARRAETLSQRILRQLRHTTDTEGWINRSELHNRLGNGLDRAALE